jgi:hypothetical protein
MRRILLSLTMVAILGVSAATSALADHAAPHQHEIVTPNGQHLVGPDVCSRPQTNQGFQNFHHNIHTGVPNSTQAFDRPNNPVNLVAHGCPQP